jgi:hypothetical protein
MRVFVYPQLVVGIEVVRPFGEVIFVYTVYPALKEPRPTGEEEIERSLL